MSRSTRVKDENGTEWIIIHNSDWSGEAYIKPGLNTHLYAGLPVPGFVIKNGCRKALAEELSSLVSNAVEDTLSAWEEDEVNGHALPEEESLQQAKKEIVEALELLKRARAFLPAGPKSANVDVAIAWINSALKEKE